MGNSWHLGRLNLNDIKWLSVERATLVGDITQIKQRRTLLNVEVTRLHTQFVALDTALR